MRIAESTLKKSVWDLAIHDVENVFVKILTNLIADKRKLRKVQELEEYEIVTINRSFYLVNVR